MWPHFCQYLQFEFIFEFVFISKINLLDHKKFSFRIWWFEIFGTNSFSMNPIFFKLKNDTPSSFTTTTPSIHNICGIYILHTIALKIHYVNGILFINLSTDLLIDRYWIHGIKPHGWIVVVRASLCALRE